MSKRVHEIAKERGLPPKEVLQQLQAAGLKVKAVSSSVDEAEARRVLGGGDGDGASRAATQAPARERPAENAAPKGQARAKPRADGGERAQGAPTRPDGGAPARA